jgi:hypothetical protein
MGPFDRSLLSSLSPLTADPVLLSYDTIPQALISIMAGIMSSLPLDHTLLGGQLSWFMDLLPPAPALPLLLLTVPVLVAFLTWKRVAEARRRRRASRIGGQMPMKQP